MSIIKPARLILKYLLATNASLFDEEWTLGTGLIVKVAVVRDLRMSTIPWARAVKPALGRSCAAWLGRVQDGPTTIATDIVENRFGA